MGILNCNARQLIILAALIAEEIAEEYDSEDQEKISAILVAIAANLDIYVALTGNSEITEAPEAGT